MLIYYNNFSLNNYESTNKIDQFSSKLSWKIVLKLLSLYLHMYSFTKLSTEELGMFGKWLLKSFKLHKKSSYFKTNDKNAFTVISVNSLKLTD